jgi:putative peptidoglycan lipid II flippase
VSEASSSSAASEKRSVLKSAGAMGLGTFLSRILGLVREQVFAHLFGAGNATDAFNIAFRIPNLLRDLFAEGAMSSALVPTFTQVRKQEGDRRAWRVAGLVFRVLFVVVTLLSLVGIYFAPELVELYAASYRAVPGKFELTVRMTRILFPFFPLVALAAAYMGILNACGRFFLPGFASALFNLTSIVTGVFGAWLMPRYGQDPIIGMAVGVVLGGFVQAFCQWPEIRRQGYRFSAREAGEPAWHRDPALKRMLKLMLPGMLGLAATQLNVLINSVLATSQGAGAVSWLNYSFRLMQFPIGIFGVSLASATLAKVSSQWVDRDTAGFSATLSRSLRLVFSVNLPASAGLAFLGVPIIGLLFQHGQFTVQDTEATAAALAAYSVGLTAYSAVKVLVPACYAMGNTRLPVVSSLFSVLATIVLNLAMIRPFGYWGLALGTSLAAILNAVFLLVALRKLLRDQGAELALLPLLGSFLAYSGVALVMGGLTWFSYGALEGLPNWLRLALVVGEGAVLVLGLGKIARLSEVEEVTGIFWSRIKKKVFRS